MAKRLYALDTLRGFAALSIVLWHWQHFYAVSGTWQEGWQKSAQPFYLFLKPFYDEGWAAVDLFFALSGFIFFWLYSEAIGEGRMGAARFAWLRFSRLYPLHLVTLLAVGAMQYIFHRATGNYFIFDTNDAQHFVTNLFLAQQWLPPTLEQSFNGPAWSVSIEVLLYGVFFVFCRMGQRGLGIMLCVALAAVPLMWWQFFIARGLMGFFVGGATFHMSRIVAARTRIDGAVTGCHAAAPRGCAAVRRANTTMRLEAEYSGWQADSTSRSYDTRCVTQSAVGATICVRSTR